MQRIQFDLVDLSEYSQMNSNFRYLLNTIDVFSKFGFSYLLENKKAKSVQEKLEDFCFTYGFPKIEKCDKGKVFLNQILGEFSKKVL